MDYKLWLILYGGAGGVKQEFAKVLQSGVEICFRIR
jgi:hypothetical protein